jgi:hypothetical protein
MAGHHAQNGDRSSSRGCDDQLMQADPCCNGDIMMWFVVSLAELAYEGQNTGCVPANT